MSAPLRTTPPAEPGPSAADQDLLDSLSERWGTYIECEPGWAPLLAALDAALRRAGISFTVDQVKEKFGTLSFYAHPDESTHHDRFRALVDAAERLSGEVCEVTGGPGVRVRRAGWIRTLDADRFPSWARL